MRLFLALILALVSVPAFAKMHNVDVVILAESKDHKPYELQIICNNIKSTPLARRLIREAVQETAPNYSIEEVISKRDLMREPIKQKLATKEISGNIAIFQIFRDNTGIKNIK